MSQTKHSYSRAIQKAEEVFYPDISARICSLFDTLIEKSGRTSVSVKAAQKEMRSVLSGLSENKEFMKDVYGIVNKHQGLVAELCDAISYIRVHTEFGKELPRYQVLYPQVEEFGDILTSFIARKLRANLGLFSGGDTEELARGISDFLVDKNVLAHAMEEIVSNEDIVVVPYEDAEESGDDDDESGEDEESESDNDGVVPDEVYEEESSEGSDSSSESVDEKEESVEEKEKVKVKKEKERKPKVAEVKKTATKSKEKKETKKTPTPKPRSPKKKVEKKTPKSPVRDWNVQLLVKKIDELPKGDPQRSLLKKKVRALLALEE